MKKRFIGVLLFDASTTFEEFQRIICNLLDEDFSLEIVAEPKRKSVSPLYSAWQLIISKIEEN